MGENDWSEEVAEAQVHAKRIEAFQMRYHMPPCEGRPGARQNPPEDELRAQARLNLTGARAYDAISSRLRGYPSAQLLSREIYHFYGDTLSYIEGTDFPSSLYVIELQHYPIALRNVEIRLQLGTDRVAEALAHELLHLHLPMLGFPLGESVEVPLHLDPYAQTFLGMCRWVVNIVQHEINFQKFLALGFQRRHFLAEFVSPINHEELIKPNPRDVVAPEVDFSLWCIDYLRYLLTARHGGNEDYLRYAQGALDRGSQRHRDLEQTAVRIDRWLETGAFKDPRQVNGLLDLMRIPGFTSWVVLKFSEHRKPMALRLDTETICSYIFKCCNDPLLTPRLER
jgi:hypothetical protein